MVRGRRREAPLEDFARSWQNAAFALRGGLVASSQLSRRLLAVDALRAIAALMVLLRHSPLQLDTDLLPLKALVPFAVVGGTGVGLFLVISGFSIHLRWAARPDANHQFSLGRFWLRRMWRLYPTYYLALAVSVALLCAAKGPRQFLAAPSPWPFGPQSMPGWAQALLTATVVGACVIPIKVLDVTWSLALEEHIYAAYSLLLRLARRIQPLQLLAIAFVVSMVWGVAVQAITRSVPPYQWLDQTDATLLSRLFFRQLPARAFEWVLGLVAAEAFVGAVRVPWLLRRLELGLALVVVGAALLRFPVGAASLNDHPFYVSDVLLSQLFGVGFFIILNAALAWERHRDLTRSPVVRLAAGLGLASYSLYLLHPALLALLGPHLPAGGLGRVVGMYVMWLVIIGLAYGFYLVVERPFVARSRQVGRPDLRHERARAVPIGSDNIQPGGWD
jgi:peptidoglycan/LPS O-acetylase OafA/YrhL